MILFYRKLSKSQKLKTFQLTEHLFSEAKKNLQELKILPIINNTKKRFQELKIWPIINNISLEIWESKKNIRAN
jgi:hypothetical protein